jgi:hypothetical protein
LMKCLTSSFALWYSTNLYTWWRSAKGLTNLFPKMIEVSRPDLSSSWAVCLAGKAERSPLRPTRAESSYRTSGSKLSQCESLAKMKLIRKFPPSKFVSAPNSQV